MDGFMDYRTLLDVLFEQHGLKKDLTLEEWEDFEKWWKGKFWPYCLVHGMAKWAILRFYFKVEKDMKKQLGLLPNVYLKTTESHYMCSVEKMGLKKDLI